MGRALISRLSVIALPQSVISKLHFLLFEKPPTKKRRVAGFRGRNESSRESMNDARAVNHDFPIYTSEVFKQVLHKSQTEGLRGDLDTELLQTRAMKWLLIPPGLLPANHPL